MSVLIKGMAMPTRCLACQLNYDSCACILTGSRFYKYNTEFDPSEERLPDCPLVPVPPHGRLGDLDALHKLFLEKGKEYKGIGGVMLGAAAWCISNAPTIIPKSGGTEDE